MQGVVMCARFAFSPEMENDAAVLYSYVLDKKNDEAAKSIMKKYSVYTMLRLISGKNLLDAFDPKVVEAYWLGNDLLETVGPEELGLIIRNYGFVVNADVNKLIFGNLSLSRDQRLAPHHSLSVLLGTFQLKDITEAVIEQINESLITWGTVLEVQSESLTVSRARLSRTTGYFLQEDTHEVIGYDERFVGRLQKGDTVAIHHGMSVALLSLMQLAALKRYTERTLSVFNKLV